ncbi:hypothetical protein PENTCL1PPCAC_7886, partial [Pristionchus entomophagus]
IAQKQYKPKRKTQKLFIQADLNMQMAIKGEIEILCNRVLYHSVGQPIFLKDFVFVPQGPTLETSVELWRKKSNSSVASMDRSLRYANVNSKVTMFHIISRSMSESCRTLNISGNISVLKYTNADIFTLHTSTPEEAIIQVLVERNCLTI